VKIVDKLKMEENDEECFQFEIDNLTSLKHSNITRLYHVYNEPTKYYLVMELVSGGELFDRIVSKRSYTEEEARDVSKIICGAINYCHKNCIAHRDLKPENLLLMYKDSDTEIKIADFGFSKRVESPESRCLVTRCGTPEYVAPEVLSGKPYNTKCDTWSLGVIIYILLCGYPPFYNKSTHNLFNLILMGKYEFHEDTWGDISDEAKDLISKLLINKPNERLSAEEVLQHPWFSDTITPKLSHRDLDKCQDNLKNFQKAKFQSIVKLIIVTNRLAKAFGGRTPNKNRRRKRNSIDVESLAGLNLETIYE